MDINRVSNRLNFFKHIIVNSLCGTIVSALIVGLFLGLNDALLIDFFKNLVVVFSVSGVTSIVIFVFSAIKQFNYEEIKNKLEKEQYIAESNVKEEDLDRTISDEYSLSIAIPEENLTVPKRNKVLQLIRKK